MRWFFRIGASRRVKALADRSGALPRAWLVHEARQVAPSEALPLLADGTVGPLQIALLEAAPPALEAPVDSASEHVGWEKTDPDHLTLRVETHAPALLILSEVWDPGWTATVDGDPAPVLLANHILRAVPVPSGAHHVELRYDPPLPRLGLAITVTTASGLIGASVLLFWKARGSTECLGWQCRVNTAKSHTTPQARSSADTRTMGCRPIYDVRMSIPVTNQPSSDVAFAGDGDSPFRRASVRESL